MLKKGMDAADPYSMPLRTGAINTKKVVFFKIFKTLPFFGFGIKRQRMPKWLNGMGLLEVTGDCNNMSPCWCTVAYNT
eukprot:8507168-Ditylum_brightwellii.AAC.1